LYELDRAVQMFKPLRRRDARNKLQDPAFFYGSSQPNYS
jgi:hypothetical protein